MKIFSKPDYGLVCFQLCDIEGKVSNEITEKVAALVANCEEGFITTPNFQGNHIIRIVIGNEETTKEIIKRYFEKIVSTHQKFISDNK